MITKEMKNGVETFKSKYNRLLPAAQKIKADLEDALHEISELKERVSDYEVRIKASESSKIDSSNRVSEYIAKIEDYQDRIIAVIKIMKSPDPDHHSMCVKVANILRPPV